VQRGPSPDGEREKGEETHRPKEMKNKDAGRLTTVWEGTNRVKNGPSIAEKKREGESVQRQGGSAANIM